MRDVAHSTTNCRFESTGNGADEVVLSKILQVCCSSELGTVL